MPVLRGVTTLTLMQVLTGVIPSPYRMLPDSSTSRPGSVARRTRANRGRCRVRHPNGKPGHEQRGEHRASCKSSPWVAGNCGTCATNGAATSEGLVRERGEEFRRYSGHQRVTRVAPRSLMGRQGA